jgi:hypothetical protein
MNSNNVQGAVPERIVGVPLDTDRAMRDSFIDRETEAWYREKREDIAYWDGRTPEAEDD